MSVGSAVDHPDAVRLQMLLEHEPVRVNAEVGHQVRPEVEARSPYCHVEGAAAGVGLDAGGPAGVADDVDE